MSEGGWGRLEVVCRGVKVVSGIEVFERYLDNELEKKRDFWNINRRFI